MIIYPRTKCQTVTIKLHSPNFQHSSKCKEYYIDGTFTYLPMLITLHRLLSTEHMHICWDTSFDTSFDPIYFFPFSSPSYVSRTDRKSIVERYFFAEAALHRGIPNT